MPYKFDKDHQLVVKIPRIPVSLGLVNDILGPGTLTVVSGNTPSRRGFSFRRDLSANQVIYMELLGATDSPYTGSFVYTDLGIYHNTQIAIANVTLLANAAAQSALQALILRNSKHGSATTPLKVLQLVSSATLTSATVDGWNNLHSDIKVAMVAGKTDTVDIGIYVEGLGSRHAGSDSIDTRLPVLLKTILQAMQLASLAGNPL